MTGQKLVVDVATVRQLSNPADINRLLIDAVALERSIDGDLEALLASRAVVDDALVSLKADTSEALRTAKEGAAKLCASTADTAALADKVSRKVRELDAAQSRVRATLSRIETIVDRSRAVEGIQAALERDDLEAAAGCVSRFLEIEDEERKEAGGGEDVASPKPAASPKSAMDDVTGQAAVMAEQRAKLEAAVRSKAAHAVAVKDHAAVARYARLFGPLRLQQEGVDLLVKYLRGLLAERAQADYDALVDGFAAGAKADYIEAVTNLFRDAAAAIDEHLELFRDAFGPDYALTAVHAVHAECDIRGTRILQRFVDHRGLPRIAGQISMRRRDDTGAEAAPVEPRRVEAFLSELLTLCTRGEEYTQYLLMRMAEAAAPAALPPARETALRGGALSTTLRELLSYYISLEEYYVEESVAKAVHIDEPVPGALTSSMVDDSFFVLLAAGRRALATARAPSAVSILNQLNTVLSTQYRTALARKLQGAAGRLAAAAPHVPGGPPDEAAAAAAALPFNNADISALYVDKLRQQLEELAGQLFPAAHDRDRIKLVLADLGKTAADFRRLCVHAAEQLCTALAANLRPLLEEFVGISYELDGSEEATVAWSRAMLVAFSTQYAWLQAVVTPGVYEATVTSAVDKVVARMEAAVAQKRFTQLGGLQLERDVRALMVGLTDATGKSQRERFSRLQQTATVLGLETAEEASELMKDGGVAWRLSSLDIRQALSQRVDFTGGAAAAVRLH